MSLQSAAAIMTVVEEIYEDADVGRVENMC